MTIRWKLREVMARYRITGISLAKELKVNPIAITNLKNAETIPRVGGDRLQQICTALTKMSGEEILLIDLFEQKQIKNLKHKDN